ncbi:MAG: hypothetical protein GY758_15680 [Fuerstiella sp.]|nr:hypothetical protein [Fuerstiella sp.]
MSDNMLSIGNDELGGPIERRIKCPQCGEFHSVEDSEKSQRWDPATEEWVEGTAGLLQFYKCGDKTFLHGIDGRALPD